MYGGAKPVRGSFSPTALANPDMFDQILDWKLSWMARNPEEQNPMQRSYTIELRVDFPQEEAKGKHAEVLKAVQAARRALYAGLELLGPQCKVATAVYTEDFFSGHQEMTLFEDLIGTGNQEMAAVTGATDATETQDASGINDELLAAVQEQETKR